jgi:nucleotide-binding universal stress UspA family protein
VSPLSVVVGADGSWPAGVLSTDDSTTLRGARLNAMNDNIDANAEAVVTGEPEPAEAILREARARDADIVVVGTHPKNWFSRIVSGSVAVDVVNGAKRSVLVMPLQSSGAAISSPVGSA